MILGLKTHLVGVSDSEQTYVVNKKLMLSDISTELTIISYTPVKCSYNRSSVNRDVV